MGQVGRDTVLVELDLLESNVSSPIGVRSSNFFAYVNQLASVWRSSVWLPDQDSALAADPNVWEKVQEDIVVRQGIQTRLHKVAGRRAKLEPGGPTERDERVVELVQEGCLDAIDNVPQARLNL